VIKEARIENRRHIVPDKPGPGRPQGSSRAGYLSPPENVAKHCLSASVMVHPQRPSGCGSHTASAKQAYSNLHSQLLRSGCDAQTCPEQPLMTHGATARDEVVFTEADGR